MIIQMHQDMIQSDSAACDPLGLYMLVSQAIRFKTAKYGRVTSLQVTPGGDSLLLYSYTIKV